MQTTEKTVHKNAIRKAFLVKRKTIVETKKEAVLEKQEALVVLLSQLLTSISSSNQGEMSVGAYRSLKEEVSLEGFYQSCPYIFSFPKISDKSLNFYEVPKAHLSLEGQTNSGYWFKSALGVLEPKQVQNPTAPEVLLIPGVAFDKDLMRLGFGGGFYDRFLKDYSGIKVGISFSDYISEESLPYERHDIAMDFIITEKCILQKINQ